MIHDPPALTIHRGFKRPSKKIIEKFRGAQTSHIADAMDGRGALDYCIKPLDEAQATFVGPAVTAHSAPADIVGMFGGVHVNPGDIVVGDPDAVVIIPQEQAEDIAVRLAEIQEAEKGAIKNVASGATMPASMANMIANALILEKDS